MKHNGFSFVEVMFSFTLLLIVVLTILPLLVEVQLNQKELAVKRHALSTLHDHMQTLDPSSLPLPSEVPDPDFSTILYSFKQEGSFIKGCTYFTHSEKKEICLYAPQ
ncbi:hypothetical protein LCM20_05825 [Halobacillus litoralis]|uniref:hypothetical protein n=1 Tax=Halobacillus litoralis TaxID=45668 RepID=UPI001CD5D3AF|nr:hypothetical protein [Halobacillus litoralis]MCA0970096.1 hypothetical protein [Halobacillus litoralis]